jgi:hypothetical protein
VHHAVLHRELRGAPDLPPGCLRAIAAFQRVQADRRAQGRRLYFAGDHLVGPGVEAAVASGRRAAGDVLADLGGAG